MIIYMADRLSSIRELLKKPRLESIQSDPTRAWKAVSFLFFGIILCLCGVILIQSTKTNSASTNKTDTTITREDSQKTYKEGVSVTMSDRNNTWQVYKDTERLFQLEVPQDWVLDDTCTPEEYYDDFCAYSSDYQQSEAPIELAEPGQEFPPENGVIIRVFVPPSGQTIAADISTEQLCDQERYNLPIARCEELTSEENEEEFILVREMGEPVWRVDQMLSFDTALALDLSADYATASSRIVIDEIFNTVELLEP